MFESQEDFDNKIQENVQNEVWRAFNAPAHGGFDFPSFAELTNMQTDNPILNYGGVFGGQNKLNIPPAQLQLAQENQERMAKMTGLFMQSLQFMNPMMQIYGGQLAKRSPKNTQRLYNAQLYAKKGVPSEGIRNMTGWFQGVDKSWRFEIDDSVASLNTMNLQEGKSEATVGDILNHPTLFKHYPELKDKPIVLDIGENVPNSGRLIGGKDNFISIKGGIENVKSTLIHELQHAVQDIEGFARGGSPYLSFTDVDEHPKLKESINRYQTWLKRPEGRKALERLNMAVDEKLGEMQKNLSYDASKYRQVVFNDMAEYYLPKDMWDALERQRYEFKKIPEGREYYKRLAGEVEARDSSSRIDLTKEERYQKEPYKSQGILEENMIIRY